MKSLIRILVLAVSAACLVALSSGAALALGMPDQHQTNTSGYVIDWLPPDKLAQTFTAGLSGRLDTVDVNADAFGAKVTVQLFSTSGHLPSAPLASQILMLNDTGWTSVHFTTPAAVVKGKQYAIVIAPSTEVGWRGDCVNAYPGGQALVREGSTWYTVPGWATAFGGTLSSYCALDYAFRTYVTLPPATPTLVATPSPVSTPAATPSPAQTVQAATSAPTSAPPAPGAAGPSGGSGDAMLPLIAAGAGGLALGLLVAGLALLASRRRQRQAS